MCGICGTVRFDGKKIDADALRRGCTVLRHRGPDHSDVWVSEHPRMSVGLGGVRLAVMDPTSACDQPFHDASGRYHLVFNGEVYNYESLRCELESGSEGFSFRTQGDTEVVLASCIRRGVDALPRLDGIWALAFFDSQERKGFLARDRYGVKPLLYRANDQSLDFASEMRGLRGMGAFDRTVDRDALIHFLTFGYIADPATIYEDVRRLEPGHVLAFQPGGADTPGPYAQSDAGSDGNDKQLNYRGACAHVRGLIDDTVVRQRTADVPMGAFLSGGLDSSIIVHHLARSMSQPLKTFAVGYEGAGSYDERAFARLVADRYGTEHHELVVTDRDALDAIPRVLDHLGEPVGDSSIIPTSLIARHAARHVTVTLSGDGGDEVFGGYWRYLGHEAIRSYERIPSIVRRFLLEPAIHMLGSSKASRWQNRARQLRKLLRAATDDPIERHVDWCSILAPEARRILADSNLVDQCKARACASARDRTRNSGYSDPLNRILEFDLRYQLPSDMLQKVDLAGMMHSLEVRVPLLDNALVEAVRRLPSHYKVHKGLRKRILVDAYRGHLPDEILDRSKQGFEVPIGEYLRGPLLSMFRDVVSRDAVSSFDGVLSFEGIQSVLDDHLARRGEHADILFALLSLIWWRRSGG